MARFLVWIFVVYTAIFTDAFITTRNTKYLSKNVIIKRVGSQGNDLWRQKRKSTQRKKTQVKMVLGNGILGVGAPEVMVVCAVGYFLLGPEDLYKLSKEIGRLVAQARRTLAESAAEWQSTMDAQFELKELETLQKSAAELRDAFDFRSARYASDFREFRGADEPPPFNPPVQSQQTAVTPQLFDEENNQQQYPSQLDIDAWNAAIMKDRAEIPDAGTLEQQKKFALQSLEQEYQRRLQELQLEFDFKREKARIDFAASESDLPEMPLADLGATNERQEEKQTQTAS